MWNNWYNHFEKSLADQLKLGIDTTCNSAIPLLVHTQQKSMLAPMAVLFIIAQTGNTHVHEQELVSKLWYIFTMRYNEK